MPIEEFAPSHMQLLLLVIERVCIFLKLTDEVENLSVKARVTALVIGCAEDGERDIQKLFDCARSGFAKTESTASAVQFCKDGHRIGDADFDRDGHMLRLVLKDRFFSTSPIFVRTWADGLFEQYRVKTSDVVDDVCFQDVTCFKGRSKYAETFLIMRFDTDAELYVRP